jgi:diguanylate cyclase (GGDEF)-like protein
MPASAHICSSAATESARLAALEASRALDTAPGPGLDGLVRLGANLFDVSSAFIAMVDHDRLFLKAALGIHANESPRDHSLCAHMVESRCLEPLIVADATRDERFARDPLVAGKPFLRFLAAAPLVDAGGHCLGAFCVASPYARAALTTKEVGMLADLSALAMARIEQAGRLPADTGSSGEAWQDESSPVAQERPGHSSATRDAAWLRQREQELFRLAGLDPLTGLADQQAFAEDLASRSDTGVPFSLLLLDIDGFRRIRTTTNRRVADSVLQTLAHRLRLLFGDPLVLARLGGDEFAVILRQSSPEALRRLCRQVLHAIADPIEADASMVSVSASMGIALCPEHGVGRNLLAHADLALYEAKRKGTQVYRFFSDDLREAVILRKKTESELRHAFTDRQFEIRFQPRFDLVARRMVGAEALLRWHHPVRGLAQPGEFLDVLETSPSIARVGAWILSSACSCAARWRSSGMPDFRIAVNLFPAQVHSGHLEALVMDALAASGLPPDALELEITENTLLDKPDVALLEALGSLRRAGVSIALDDYGTGYASLSLLKRLPISRLKIDRSFVSNLPQDAEDAAVVQAVLFLGRQFGLSVVAEGIETPAQEAFLQAHGCHEGQGYLYSEALPEAEFFARYVAPSAREA